jgi:hypothetical protein
MKFQVMQQDIPVYPQMRQDVLPIRILHFGEQAEIGDRFPVRNGVAWAEVILPDQTHGYANAFSSVFFFGPVVTNQPATQFYKTPGHGVIIATLRKGAELDFLNPIVHNGEAWVRVKNRKGITGYIKADTKTLYQSKPTIANGIRNIILGVLFSTLFLGLTLGNLRSHTINWLELIVTAPFSLLTIYQVVIGIRTLVEAGKK